MNSDAASLLDDLKKSMNVRGLMDLLVSDIKLDPEFADLKTILDLFELACESEASPEAIKNIVGLSRKYGVKLNEISQRMIEAKNGNSHFLDAALKAKEIISVASALERASVFGQPRTSEANMSELDFVSSRLEEIQGQLDEFLSEQYIASWNARIGKKVELIEEKANSRIEGAAEVLIRNATESSKAFEALARENLDAMKLHLNSAEQLVTKSAAAVLTSDYADRAAREEHTANIFRLVVIFLMSVIALFLIHFAWTITKNSTDAYMLGTKAFTSLFLTVFATYLARESARHREQSEKYLRIAFDLKTFTPYLATLPSDLGNKVRASTADRLFFSGSSATKIESMPIDFQELLKKIVDKASEVEKPKI